MLPICGSFSDRSQHYHVLSLCDTWCIGNDCYFHPYAVARITLEIKIIRVFGKPAILQVEVLKRDETTGSDSSNGWDCTAVAVGPFGLRCYLYHTP